jgi:hypothetical protein
MGDAPGAARFREFGFDIANRYRYTQRMTSLNKIGAAPLMLSVDANTSPLISARGVSQVKLRWEPDVVMQI